MIKISRRQTLKLSLAIVLAALGIPKIVRYFRSQDDIVHILPAVSDNQFLIKVSVATARNKLGLRVDEDLVEGIQTDTNGRFWSFQVRNLNADQSYNLQIEDAEGAIGENWPLRTFPDPQSYPESLRLLAYTCAGGPDGLSIPSGKEVFKPLAFRHKIFESALAMNPDAVIAIGDHIYWDLRRQSQPVLGRRSSGFISQLAAWYLRFVYGAFDRDKAVLGTQNEEVLTRIGDEQIARLYGTRFKSVPVFFVSDDHDYFENDDAEEDLVTFPPDTFSREAHATIARLYYPTFMPDQGQPMELPGFDAEGNNRSFGAIRYGRLVEAVLFDCAGYLTLGGDSGEDAAGLIPENVESWLLNRIDSNDSQHFALIPSHPFGWTAGKWREWYPDVVAPEGFEGLVENRLLEDVKGVLSAKARKYLWQKGWWLQHQRLIDALNLDRGRPAIVVSGDIHALGAKKINASDDLDLSEQPIYSFLVGPVGTSDLTWPSAARGITAETPAWLAAEDLYVTEEVNGFTIFEFNHQGTEVTLVDCGGGSTSKDSDGSPRSSVDIKVS
jgi:phosphodiesterase/alkaline phosphatase D-like protein